MANPPHFLVTAGSTREMIDRVRWWGNIFTGRTGLEIAKSLLALGNVTLLTANADHARECSGLAGPAGSLATQTFVDHAGLHAKLAALVPGSTFAGIFLTAAVSDYRPAGAYAIQSVETLPDGTQRWIVQPAQQPKIKSHFDRIAFVGEKTTKLVDLVRHPWGFRRLLVKFKLEAGISEPDLIAIAQASRLASHADFIVANTLDMVDGPHAGAYIIGANRCDRIARAQLPAALCQLTRAAIAPNAPLEPT